MEDFLEIFKNKSHRLCNGCKKKAICQPESYWDKMPQDCRLEGWLFQRRETIKKQIRKLKERLLELEVEKKDEFIKSEINSIKNKINKYKNYGSNDW